MTKNNILDLPPGTPLANGWANDGKYGSKNTGNHALIFLGVVDGKVYILDQNSGYGVAPAIRRPVPIDTFVNKGYATINIKK